MNIIFLVVVGGFVVSSCGAYPQGLLILNNGNGNDESRPSPPRPYSPLPPMKLPPHFHNLGITLPPPPPPPLQFVTVNPLQIQLEHNHERFLSNFFSQIGSFLFPWITTKSPSTTTPTSSESEPNETTPLPKLLGLSELVMV